MSTTDLKSQRICVFVPTLNQGGAERVMVKLANAFQARGYPVDLVVATLTGPHIREVADGVTVVDLGCSRTATAVWPLMRYLRSHQPVGLLSTLTHANVVATIAVRLSGLRIRTVLREAGLPTLDTKQSRDKGPKGILKIAQWVFPYADCVVGVSNGVKDELVSMLKIDNKVEHLVIYNPVISDGLYQLADTPVAESLSNVFRKPVVLGVGRMAPEKDFATLIKAFAKVRESLDCHLLILGEGALKNQLQALVDSEGLQDSVFMPGFVDNPYPYIKKCTVYVLSSVSEGLPNALIESLALGVPVVSTSIVNGPSEILEDGTWGDLVPIGNSEAMADSIVNAIRSDVDPIPASHPWWQRFSEPAVVDTYLEKLLR